MRAGADWAIEGTLVAPVGAADDRLGTSVAIDGDLAAAGAPRRDDGASNAGAVQLFERSAGVWSPLQQLGASDPAAGDEFGGAVALSGDTLVVGARFDDDLGTSAGSVYVFARGAEGFAQEAKLLAADGAADDSFGSAVAIDGDTLVVGAPGHDDVSAPGGAAYVFERVGGVWTEAAEIEAPSAFSAFGSSVAVDGDWIAVGAPAANLAYAYERVSGIWMQRATLSGPLGFGDPRFGAAIDLDADLLAVGDPGSGRISVFERRGSDLAYFERLQRRFADGATSAAVAISGSTIFAGKADASQVSAFTLSRCGDGAVGIHESCDDGNHVDGDGCSASCRWDCSDGLDNDGDELADFGADPGCASAEATTESPQCDDEIDNDGDGRIDWDGGAGAVVPDPQCVARPARDREAKSGCGLGVELTAALGLLRTLSRRRRDAAAPGSRGSFVR